jgi:hypothetical protein
MISSCGSMDRLSRDHILPSFFLRRTKLTNAPFISILSFTTIALAIFGIVDTNLTILSGQFAISYLTCMGLFALSNIFLKCNRDRLVRVPRVGLPTVLLALGVSVAAIGGNIALSPEIVGYFAVFFVVAWVGMMYTGSRGKLATLFYWIYNRNERLHEWRWTKDWHLKLINKIKTSKSQPIIFFAKTDEAPISPTLLTIDLGPKQRDSLHHSQRMHKFPKQSLN